MWPRAARRLWLDSSRPRRKDGWAKVHHPSSASPVGEQVNKLACGSWRLAAPPAEAPERSRGFQPFRTGEGASRSAICPGKLEGVPRNVTLPIRRGRSPPPTRKGGKPKVLPSFALPQSQGTARTMCESDTEAEPRPDAESGLEADPSVSAPWQPTSPPSLLLRNDEAEG